MRQTPANRQTAAALMSVAPAATPGQTNDDILSIFTRHPHLSGLPVVENDRPIGLINRNQFMNHLARPFHREIFGRKSCIAFMDNTPRVVAHDTPLTDLSYLALSNGDKTLNDGFIVTDHDRYAGVGLGVDLMRAMTDLTAEKNRQVMESIHYASVIQQSFLRHSRRDMAATLDDYFMHWAPRDVVGGDYYYFVRRPEGFFAAVIDCTGHGVPGAFMTLIMASALNQVLRHADLRDPAGLLGEINRMVKASLGQQADEVVAADSQQSDDGMDTAFLFVDSQTRRMTFAGAKTPVFLLTPGSDAFEVLDGNRMGVGYVATPDDYCWDNREVTLAPGTTVYVSTDGLIDQIGGSKRIAFGKRRLRETLLRCRDQPLPAQQAELLETFDRWQGSEPRRDDVTVFGFRLP